MKIESEVDMKDLCYWSIGDGDFAYMLQTLVSSFREVGMVEDFHVFSDKEIVGATNHYIRDFDKSFYLFKFGFLQQFMKHLDYRYFVFIDADSYFVRKPHPYLNLLKKSPIHAFLESDFTIPTIRKDWHTCPLPKFVSLMRDCGITNEKIYNVNGGFFIVQREVIDVVCGLAIDFWQHCFQNGYAFTEEPSLAYVTQMLCEDPEQHLLRYHSDIWGTDWTGHYKDHLPDGKAWIFKDYFNHELYTVNPAMVHVLKGKPLLIENGRKVLKVAAIS